MLMSKSRNTLKIRRISAILGLAAAMAGCGAIRLGSPDASCPAGTAQIAVFDTAMQRVCGCTEPAGQYFTTAGSLTCTIRIGTAVNFTYVGITNSHQIVISPLYSSPIRGPSSTTLIDSYEFRQTGTFPFQDSFSPSNIGGTFIVTP
jgi:hypothetical protein